MARLSRVGDTIQTLLQMNIFLSRVLTSVNLGLVTIGFKLVGIRIHR
jgi:hypothetical protein